MKQRKNLILATLLFVAFVLWTFAVTKVDVQAAGPYGSFVGFTAVNLWFHNFTGVHMWLYSITDWLSILPLAFIIGFGLLGLFQWIRRKRLLLVDKSILILGGFYIVVMAVFLIFEFFAVNYRPILIEGVLESSYPSSTTMLVMCVLPTAVLQLRSRIQNPFAKNLVCCALTVFGMFMVIARLVSGVHWLTDIIGGIWISSSLVTFYRALTE